MSKICRVCGIKKLDDQFYTNRAVCKRCCTAYSVKYQREHKAQTLAKARRYRAKHPTEGASRTREWRRENPSKVKTHKKVWRKKSRFCVALISSRANAKIYGYTPCLATPSIIADAFTGRCDICGREEMDIGSRLHMDHDHVSGKFRGWLCCHCNRGIGSFMDSVQLIRKAATWLARSKRED